MLDKVLSKIKKISGIETLDDSKILIKTDDEFRDSITLKNVVILMTCVIKNYNKFYSQIFLEEALLVT